MFALFKLKEADFEVALFLKVIEIDAFIAQAVFGIFKCLGKCLVLEVEASHQGGGFFDVSLFVPVIQMLFGCFFFDSGQEGIPVDGTGFRNPAIAGIGTGGKSRDRGQREPKPKKPGQRSADKLAAVVVVHDLERLAWIHGRAIREFGG